MCLERFPVVQLARSDNEAKVATFGKPLLEKFVNVVPGAPMPARGQTELRREFAEFEHEFREYRRRDSRKSYEGKIQ